MDATDQEREELFRQHPWARAYRVAPYSAEEPVMQEQRAILPGWIMLTPTAEGYDTYLINVATIQTINPAHQSTIGARTCINFDSENYELVKESFEEVLLLMAVALN